MLPSARSVQQLNTPHERERAQVTETKTKAKTKAVATQSKPKLTRGEQAGADVTLSLRARCAGFWIISRDEARTEQDLVPAIAKAGYKPQFWDIASGIVGVDGSALRGDPEYNPVEDPDQVLELILRRSKASRTTSTDRNVWILRDMGVWLEGPAGAAARRSGGRKPGLLCHR